MTKERYPERNAEIRRLHAEGVSQREIGRRLQMPHSNVWQVLNPQKANESLRRAHHKRYGVDSEWTEAKRAYMRAYYARRKAAQSAGAAE
jgi:DNA-binding IclR family transcriptional regulator